MKDWLADVTKWIVVIAVAATSFYLVYPKYYFMKVGQDREKYFTRTRNFRAQGIGVIRYNTITGKSRHFIYDLNNYKTVYGNGELGPSVR